MRRLWLLLFAFAFAPASGAEAEVIRSFSTDVRLAADGSFTVEERIVYDFGMDHRHGIYRDIPVRYGRGHAADYRIGLEVLSVTDDVGAPRPYRTTSEGRNRRIRIGHPDRNVTGRQEYRIRYQVRRGILWFDDHDELYWNATGTEWKVPIQRAEATVMLPPEAGPVEVQTLCFTGAQGSVETACASEVGGGSVGFATQRKLAAREGLTLVLALPKGVLAQPSELGMLLDRASDFWSHIFWIPIAVFLGMGGWWWSFGRDAQGVTAIPVRYEPPENMTPAEMGTVLDEEVHIGDITSTILDLAVRGYLEIEELETKRFLFLSDTDYELRRLKKADEALKEHEKTILAKLFRSGSSVKVSELRNEFYKYLDTIREDLYDEVSHGGRYFPASPDKVRKTYLVAGIVLAIFGFLSTFVTHSFPITAALIASGVIVVLWGRHMPRRTLKGRRAAQHILGFREFLERVEVDRLERLGLRSIAQFERLLPYAFVLGAADEWAEAFADLYTTPPSWYHGHTHGGSFRPRRFVSNLGRSLETCGQAMKSQPRSSGSGSSGFGGGGFSGGGFGGGGGGSW